jgi:hypothetical protein
LSQCRTKRKAFTGYATPPAAVIADLNEAEAADAYA